MANAGIEGVQRLFSGATGAVVSAILIAAITALVTLWRDVSVIQRRQETTLRENAEQHVLNQSFAITEERVRQITEVLTRFRGSYDKTEDATIQRFDRHSAFIAELQQKVHTLTDHVTMMEQRLQRLEHSK